MHSRYQNIHSSEEEQTALNTSSSEAKCSRSSVLQQETLTGLYEELVPLTEPKVNTKCPRIQG